MQTEDQGFC